MSRCVHRLAGAGRRLGRAALSSGEQLHPKRWAALVQVHGRLHDHRTEPGLTDLSAAGFCENAGVRIAWYEVGPQDAEATVVFIHGFSLSSESYYEQVNYLRREFPRARCLLVDIRGHGQSQRVKPAACTVSAAADDVIAALEERAPRGRLVLVGHSLGGMVALNLIRRAPADIFERIESALLVSTSMQPFAKMGAARVLNSWALRAVYALCMRLPGRMEGARLAAAKVLAPALASMLEGYPRMDALRFHAAMLIDTPISSYTGFFDDLSLHEEFAATERLRRLDGEILVGGSDIVTPRPQSEIIAARWGRARLTEVPDAGHMVILEEPEQVARALGRLLGR